MSSLRDRNRRATMEHVQDTAFALFDEHGYHQVTIAQISQVAGVSPSTFYRLFQTKEGLFTAVPWDAPNNPLEKVDAHHLVDLVRELVAGNQWRGMKWVMSEPTVRSAVLSTLDELAQQLATMFVEQGGDPLAVTVEVRSLLFGAYFTSLERWHLDGQGRPFEEYFNQAVQLTNPKASALQGHKNATQGGR